MGGALPSPRPLSWGLLCNAAGAWKPGRLCLDLNLNGEIRQFTELWALPRVEAAPGKHRAAEALVSRFPGCVPQSRSLEALRGSCGDTQEERKEQATFITDGGKILFPDGR